MGLRPNYMIIGASKCATTSICNMIGRHPEVFMVECKEPSFFNDDDNYAKGLAWYESLYEKGAGKKALGEGSNRYTEKERFPHTVERIHAYVPDVKLIYVTRHPLERMESFWIQKLSRSQRINPDFNKAMREHREAFVDSSNYYQQIQAYRGRFRDEQIKLMFYEDFARDTAGFIRDLLQFLEVDPSVSVHQGAKAVNVSKGKKIDTKAMSLVRRVPGFDAWRHLLPKNMRSWAKDRFLRRTVDDRPAWDDDTRDWVLSIIEQDTLKFLALAGKPADYWDLRGHGRRQGQAAGDSRPAPAGYVGVAAPKATVAGQG